MTYLKWCFFAKIVYRLKSLTILKRSSILRSITGCWICPGYFFRFTFIVDLFLLLTFLNIKGTTTLHTNVSLTTGIPQRYLSCRLDVLVNFGQIFAPFFGTFIVGYQYWLFIANATLSRIFVLSFQQCQW